MVKHIVCWNFLPELSEEEKNAASERIRKDLTALKGRIEGLLELEIFRSHFSTGNRELALISSFDSMEALERYGTHPLHVEAGTFLRQVTCDRVCFDYE